MFTLLYDCCLAVLGLVALPKLLWGLFRKGKYKKSLLARFGAGLPVLSRRNNSPIIWIHAVSVGEAKAASPLFHAIKKNKPGARIVISTTTETGQEEAKRSMPDAAHYFYLPFDFSWLMKKAVQKIGPNALILVESDFWYNLLKIAKNSGASVLLVNGKMSLRSMRRFKKIPFLSKRLFRQFDRLCLQSQNYSDRFLQAGAQSDQIAVTGNLKYDHPIQQLPFADRARMKEELGITPKERVIVIGSTHAPEEECILSETKKIPQCRILLIPRHPERFEEVAGKLRSQGFSVLKWSESAQKRGDEQVILIDRMGLLTTCYQLADVAIVGGSYVETVGGHNVFEPVQCGIPTLFGPYMHSQLDLRDLLLSANAAKQVPLPELERAITELLHSSEKHAKLRESALTISDEMRGASQRTFAEIASFLKTRIEHK